MIAPRSCPTSLLLILATACRGDEQDSGQAWSPSVEEVQGVLVLRLAGTAYEMGWQTAELLRDELLAGGEYIDDSELALMEPLAAYYGLDQWARDGSYQDVIDECQGLADGLDDEAWSMERCLLLAYGDVVIEAISQKWGCSQFIASGAATLDGGLIHGRNLDWSEVSFIVENPTLIVRHPTGGVPWVAFGFPGNISPYNGMNARGLSFASNEAYGTAAPDGQGRAHTQMARQVLQQYGSLDEARSFIEGEQHTSAEILVFADGDSSEGAVHELAADGMSERRLSADGLLYTTNHFVDPATEPLHEALEKDANSLSRYLRLEQLLEPDGAASLHGQLDLEAAVAVLRDSYNPVTKELHDPALFDGGGTLANNGAIQSLVMLPEQGLIYVAAGGIPVPQNSFVGFSLGWLFGETESNDVQALP